MTDFNLRSPWGEIARCIVNSDKTVAYFLDANDSNLKADGTAVDWMEVRSAGQNVMVQIPKFYFVKKWIEEEKHFYFGVAKTPIATDHVSLADWKVHPAFYRDRTKFSSDPTGVPIEVDFRYIGAFEASSLYGIARSLPGLAVEQKNVSVWKTEAENNGVGWGILDFSLWYAVQMLYITEYGDPNSQGLIGNGRTGASIGIADSGLTLASGNKSTVAPTGSSTNISYRGMENLWGNATCILDGISRRANENLIIATANGDVEIAVPYTSTSGYNIRNISTRKEAGFLPSQVTVDNVLGIKDGLKNLPTAAASDCIVTVGGDRDMSLSAHVGIFAMNIEFASWSRSSRLTL